MIKKYLDRKIFSVIAPKDLESMKTKVKNALLFLENDCFEILKLELQKDLNAEERAIFIETELQTSIPDYHPDEYIQKELLLQESLLSQTLIILLLKTEIALELIGKAKNQHIPLSGIFPGFLYDYLSQKNSSNSIFIDIGIKRTILVQYLNHTIIDLDSFFIDKDELLTSSTEFTMFSKRLQQMILSSKGPLDNLEISPQNFDFMERLTEIFSNVKIIVKNFSTPFFCSQKIAKTLNFIPFFYQSQLRQKLLQRRFLLATGSLLSLEFIFFLIFIPFESGLQKEKTKKEEELRSLSEIVLIKKQQIEEFTDYQDKIHKLSNQANQRNIFFTNILKNLLSEMPPGITLTFLEYKKQGKIQIRGIATDDSYIYIYEEKIANNNCFSFIHQDYIREKNGIYEFQMDLSIGDSYD